MPPCGTRCGALSMRTALIELPCIMRPSQGRSARVTAEQPAASLPSAASPVSEPETADTPLLAPPHGGVLAATLASDGCGQRFARRARRLRAMTEARNQKAPKAEYPARVDRPLVAEPDMAAKAAPARTDSPPLMIMGHWAPTVR